MKISLDWLKKYVDIPSSLKPDELALKLTMSTVEVEEVLNLAKDLQGIVVGKVVELKKHPNADKLKLAVVDTGQGMKQVVCGGTNLKQGILVAFAPVGSMVRWHGQGEPVKLEKAKIRGEISEGMICASNEIGLEELLPIGETEITDLSSFDFKAGQPLAQALGLDDIVFDIENKSLTHRPDLWSHVGIAREVAAILGKKLKEPKIKELKEGREVNLKVEIVNKAACPRYIGVAVSGIKIEPSPLWMQKLLLAVGMRPINNIVDITNFVMLEMGQPLHAFDIRQIEGNKIVVKKATEGQKFTTLDGQERKLTKDDLLINDSKKGVALAGVMGGENSEVQDDTQTIILESANFDAVTVRRTSTRLGLRTEASTRFEKSLDPLLAESAVIRAVNLIQELIPTAKVASKFVDINYAKPKKIVIDLNLDFLNKRIGQDIPTQKVVEILTSLEFKVKKAGKNLKVEVPTFRATKDVSIPEDLVEEVARIYGFENIKVELPEIKMERPEIDEEKVLEKKIKNFLVGVGFDEVYNYSFIGPDEQRVFGYQESELLKLKNYFSIEQSLLRPSLLPNLIKNVESNLRFFNKFKIFELGKVFFKEEGEYKVGGKSNQYLPFQPKRLTGLIVQKQPQDLFYQVKGVVEALLKHLDYEVEFIEGSPKQNLAKAQQSLLILVNKKEIGHIYIFNQNIYRVKAEVGVFDLDFEELVKLKPKAVKYQGLPEFPSVKRDLAVVIDDKIKWQQVRDEVKKTDKLIKEVSFLSYFPAKKSLAMSIIFRADDRTLESEEVDKMMDKILKKLGEKLGAKLR